MPIDPRIPLLAFQGGGGGTLSNPMGMMQDFVQLQRQQEELRKQQREAQQEQEIQTIMQQSGGDWDRAVDGLLARGYGGVAAKLRTEVEQGRKVAADKIKTESETARAQLDAGLQLLTGIEDIPDPARRNTTYQVRRGLILQMAPDLERIMPEEYDQDVLTGLRDKGATSKEIMETRIMVLESLAKRQPQKALAELIAGSPTPEALAEGIEGFRHLAGSKIANPLIATMLPDGQWSEDARQRSRQYLTEIFTPEQANVQRGQDITAATAVRGQDVSAATQRRGQDISADVQRRGQDISAATQRRGQDLTDARTKAGGDVKLSAGQQQDLEAMLTLSDLAKETRALGDKIGWKGVGAGFQGSALTAASRFLGYGTDEERSLRNKINNILANIAKLRGGTAFTETEWKLLESYTPTINDSDADIKQKLTDLEDTIEKKRRNMLKIASGDLSPNQSAPAAGRGGGSDPLGIRR